MQLSKQQLAMRCVRVSILVNAGLAVLKLLAGIFARSAALVSDAVHNFADLISGVVLLIGVRLSHRQADNHHNYGHERFECVTALALALLVGGVGAGIGYHGAMQLLAWDFYAAPIPGIAALVVAIISIVAKEALFWYMRRTAQRVDSGALMADAWHNRADALASIGSFVGILGARLGWPMMDSVAAIVISLFVLRTAVQIARDALGKMTDRACDENTLHRMQQVILQQSGVLGMETIKTRLFGNRVFVDVHILVDTASSLQQAQIIAKQVHDEIEAQFPNVKHCSVHFA